MFRTKRRLTEDKLTPEDETFNGKVEGIAQAHDIKVTTGALLTSMNKIEVSDKERETLSLIGFIAVDMEASRLRRFGKMIGRHLNIIRAFADLCQPLQEADQEKKNKDRQDAVNVLATILKEF